MFHTVQNHVTKYGASNFDFGYTSTVAFDRLLLLLLLIAWFSDFGSVGCKENID